MKSFTRYATILALGLAATSSTQAASYRGLAKGLSLFDFRFSGQHNLLGDGITVNANAFYSNREFDFGVADLTLNGSLNLQAGWTSRGIPAVNFKANSGGAPLSYVFNMNNGIQDLTATGSVLIDIDSHINALGFYDEKFEISNRGTFDTKGYGLVDNGTLAFDAGPINIHGNIFADAIGAITEPFFAATGTVNPFVKFSAKSQKAMEASQKAEDLRARIDAGEVLSDEEMSALVNNTILAAMLGGQPDSKLFDGLLVPTGLLEEASTQKLSLEAEPTPEPASIFVLAATVPLLRRRSPRAI
jgi:hypothetical protein